MVEAAMKGVFPKKLSNSEKVSRKSKAVEVAKVENAKIVRTKSKK